MSNNCFFFKNNLPIFKFPFFLSFCQYEEGNKKVGCNAYYKKDKKLFILIFL